MFVGVFCGAFREDCRCIVSLLLSPSTANVHNHTCITTPNHSPHCPRTVSRARCLCQGKTTQNRDPKWSHDRPTILTWSPNLVQLFVLASEKSVETRRTISVMLLSCRQTQKHKWPHNPLDAYVTYVPTVCAVFHCMTNAAAVSCTAVHVDSCGVKWNNKHHWSAAISSLNGSHQAWQPTRTLCYHSLICINWQNVVFCWNTTKWLLRIIIINESENARCNIAKQSKYV